MKRIKGKLKGDVDAGGFCTDASTLPGVIIVMLTTPGDGSPTSFLINVSQQSHDSVLRDIVADRRVESCESTREFP